MGAGIAKTIKQTFPQAYEADLQTKKGDRSKLGTITYAEVEINKKKLTVVNAYTQYNWRGSGAKADYAAIESAFKRIKAQFTSLKIGYPAIGAGLAGGDWVIISKIIDAALAGEDHTLVLFEQK
jgi:O-acetyl-ADP-ribose deacetylase (regulator of RNase III)